MYEIQTEQYQGPLDVLLQLIEKQKMDISQISLANVTDQYLSYLDQASEIEAADLADFLVVATKLLIIKSKVLLPDLADEEEDSAEALENQLKIYKDYHEAALRLEAIIKQSHYCFSRDKLVYEFKPTFSPPEDLTGQMMSAVFQALLSRIDYVVNLPQKVVKQTVSLKQMVSSIRSLVNQTHKLSFQTVLQSASSRDDIVVSFIALLELIKAGEVAVNQKGVFDDIYLQKV